MTTEVFAVQCKAEDGSMLMVKILTVGEPLHHIHMAQSGLLLTNGRIVSNKFLADKVFHCFETAGRLTILFNRIKGVC